LASANANHLQARADITVAISKCLRYRRHAPGRVLRKIMNREPGSLYASTPCVKTGLLPQSSPPPGEIRERERAALAHYVETMQEK